MGRVDSRLYDSSRRYEMIVYAVLWLLVFVLPFINQFIRFIDGQPFLWCSIVRWFIGLIPFIFAFIVNNFILVPRFFLKHKIKSYVVLLILLVFSIVCIQDFSYEYRLDALNKLNEHLDVSMSYKPRKYYFLGMPMPVVLNMSLLLLFMVVNMLIIMVFKYIREKESRRMIENIHLQDELKFLKAQINPHFFMNMLNSIHAMIELDSEKAQELTLELSKMMRYVLYGGENQVTALTEEIRFMQGYISLVSKRYPKSKVDIRLSLPDTPSENIKVPPLIFVTFIENAFKHGVSYQKMSVIDIRLEQNNDKVHFVCINTKPAVSKEEREGIGLQNVIRRLYLMYGENYQLDIEEGADTYKVELIIPSL